MAVKTKFFKSKASKKSNMKAKSLLKECMNKSVQFIEKEERNFLSNDNRNTSSVDRDRHNITMNTEPPEESKPVMDLKTKLLERMRLDDHKLQELRNESNKLKPIKEEHVVVKTMKKEPEEHTESLLDVLDTFIKENVKPVKREPKKREKKKINKKIEPKLPNESPKSSFSFLEVSLPKSLLESFDNSSSFKVNTKSSLPSKEVNIEESKEEERKQEIYEKYNKRFYSDGLKIHKNPNFKYKTDIYGKPIIEKFEDLPVIYSPIPERKYVTLEEFERVEYKLDSIGKRLEFE